MLIKLHELNPRAELQAAIDQRVKYTGKHANSLCGFELGFKCVPKKTHLNSYSANKASIAAFALHWVMASAICASFSLCWIASTPL